MSNETKQTAVEWLVEKINEQKAWANPQQLKPLIKQAKEIEKEQIEEAYKYARAHWSREDGNAERYYEQTYGSNK
jgi:hypothetical protein